MKIINVIMFTAMVVMNYLANALPINGKTTGQISAQYDNLFVPAGITFSIWGVIYLMLLGFCIIQFRSQNKALVESVGWAFAISCLFNSLWIIAWHYDKLPISLILMIGLLAILIYINIRLKDTTFVFAKAAFGIYLGWICIATIANVAALLVNYQWGAWGIAPQIWTIIMIAIGLSIAIIAMYKMLNPFIGLSIIWAFAGIMINRINDVSTIAYSALIAMILLAVFTIWLFFKKSSVY